METKLQELKNRLAEISRLQYAVALLSWDQMTFMPPGGAAARGRQIAALEQLVHEKATHPELGRLLEELEKNLNTLEKDSDEARLIRIAIRDYRKAKQIPAEFAVKFAEHTTQTYEVWAKARAERNFRLVEPMLQKSLELSREMANFFPGYEHIADPLIDQLDEGLKVSFIRPLFNSLRQELTPMVQAITSQGITDDSCLRQYFPQAEQLRFGLEIAKVLGYDFTRGRLDQSPHPFTTNFSIGDVRITTRVDEHYLGDSLFSIIHETGHALYEQGINPDYEETPFAGGTSMSIHESQSRLWENLVGRSLDFWEYSYTKLQEVFPEQLRDIPLHTFYRAINKVERSLIRTDADEVTYNLHVMIRFDLETAMLEGSLTVHDLPEAWNERYRLDLGVVPPDDALGVLQDMHWFSGTVGGYFQSYTLGNILSAQFFNAALKAHPEIPLEMRRGELDTLHGWLKDHIYQYGKKFTANELISRVTGEPLKIDAYVQYLRDKYGKLYQL